MKRLKNFQCVPDTIQLLGYPPTSGIQTGFDIPFISKQKFRDRLSRRGRLAIVFFILLTVFFFFFFFLLFDLRFRGWCFTAPLRRRWRVFIFVLIHSPTFLTLRRSFPR